MQHHLLKPMVGKRFGRLVVLACIGYDSHRNIMYMCHCDCGNFKRAPGSALRSGATRSCGCLQRESLRQNGLANLGKKYRKEPKLPVERWSAELLMRIF